MNSSSVVQVREESRGSCRRCRQAAANCFCAELVSQHSRAHLVFLQHPREARNPVGTARMAHLSVPGSELLIGVDFGGHPRFAEALAAARDAVVLFPAEGARPASELAARRGPFTAFVIDGTWSQAKKIWQSNPDLRRLPAYRIEPREPSRYEIRAEPAVHCLSTIEAVAELLDAVEGTRGAHEPMLAPFLGMVSRQQRFASAPSRSPRWRTRTFEPRPPPRLPAALRGRLDSALIVHAEGNGWPTDLENRPPTELVQLVAFRPATGERFSATARPMHGLSPRFSALELDPDEVAASPGVEALREAWSSFGRPGDVALFWGSFPSRLAKSAGVTFDATVDLQQWCSERLGRGAGGVEAAHLAIGAGPPRMPALAGRGGGRLGMLAEIYEALRLLCETE